jgi:hypothetical protein
MSQTQTIQANNAQIETLLKSNSTDSATIKSLTKKNKILVYTVDDLSKESEQFLFQASTFSLISGKFSELNLLAALTTNNPRDFELAIDNVRFFYENTLISTPSSEYHLVTAIHLLFLLSSHKNEEFYAKIETLQFNDLKDKYISYVLLLNDAIE